MDALSSLGRRHLAGGMGRMSDVVMERGLGCYLFDVEGRKYLDMTSGIGVTNMGHCHPRVVEAASEQMGKLVHGQVNIAMHKPMIELTQNLTQKVMPFNLDTFFFWNSGAEAVEAAVKLSRHASGKPDVIVFQGGYHGRTIGTMSLTTSKTIYRSGYSPLMPGVHVAPYPYSRQLQFGDSKSQPLSEEACAEQSLAKFELLLKQQVNASDVACVLIEPVLGEGGYVAPHGSFFEGLRSICDSHGMLLVFDEVQSGFGRTGKFFACEHFNVAPDVLVFAKGIANGMPLSGIASRKELMDLQPKGSQGGTYAGNAVSCAAANATIDAMIDEKIFENVAARSKQMRDRLAKMQTNFKDEIIDVRGKGLMIGVEFDAKLSGVANDISKSCLEKGMLVLTTSVFETLRLIPPLNVSASEVDDAMDILEASLESTLRSKST